MELKDRSVLVTGSDGFIGSHLCEALLREQCRLRAFVYYNSHNSWGWLDTLPAAALGKLDVFVGDVRDPHGVRKAMEGVEVVFHLAALIGIPFSYHSPDSYVDTNVKGTLNILQAARDSGAERVVVTSTSEVYGTAQYVPIDERHPIQAQSPYSAAKAGADRLAESFHCSFGTPVVIARPFNTYGPRQSARAVIPTVISQLLAGYDEIRLGALHPTRDLNFVTDTVSGLIDLARCDAAVGREVNIGSGEEISIEALARKLTAIINPKARIVSDAQRLRPADSEVDRLLSDSTLLRTLTGWSPQVSLQEGLERTIGWFREPGNLARYKAHVYNV